MAVAPFQRLHGLLLSTQRRAPRGHWQPGSRSFQLLVFAALSVHTAYFKSSCGISLTCPEFPFYLPEGKVSISETCKSQLWQLSKEHQGRVETLLSDLLIGMCGKFY